MVSYDASGRFLFREITRSGGPRHTNGYLVVSNGSVLHSIPSARRLDQANAFVRVDASGFSRAGRHFGRLSKFPHNPNQNMKATRPPTPSFKTSLALAAVALIAA